MRSIIFFLLWTPFAVAQDLDGNITRPACPSRRTSLPAKSFAAACSGCHGSHGEGERGPNLADGKLVRRSAIPGYSPSFRKGFRAPKCRLPAVSLQIRQVIAYARSLSAPAVEAQVPGDARKGREIFFGKGECAKCHMILGQGGYLGPDLSNEGLTRSWKQLRDALLDAKSRSIAGYEGVTAVTKEGAKIIGIARNHTNYSLDIQDATGELHLLSVRDLRNVNFDSQSIMPADYDKRLTPSEIDDVLAYSAVKWSLSRPSSAAGRMDGEPVEKGRTLRDSRRESARTGAL